MGIKFRCKSCGNQYNSDDALAGESFRCESCGGHMQVPQSSADLDTVLSADTTPEILDKKHLQSSDANPAIVEVHCATLANQRQDDIKFACKICGHKYRLASEFGGHEAECAKCKRILIIPRHSDDAPEDLQSGQIVFWCKACGQKYRLPHHYARNRAHCSKCKISFVVPYVSENGPPAQLLSDTSASVSSVVGVKPPAPPEQTAWLESRHSKRHQPQAVSEKSHAPQKTRVQIVQGVLASKSLQTQTTVELTGNPVSMIRYVLASPNHNILSAAFGALIDWIRLLHIFKHVPRQLIGTFIILCCVVVAALAGIALRRHIQSPHPESRLVSAMCLDCKFVEPRVLSNINAVHCSKCKGDLGYAWKCYKCGKDFSRPVSQADENVLQPGKIPPPDCPICASNNVKYIQPEVAHGGGDAVMR